MVCALYNSWPYVLSVHCTIVTVWSTWCTQCTTVCTSCSCKQCKLVIYLLYWIKKRVFISKKNKKTNKNENKTCHLSTPISLSCGGKCLRDVSDCKLLQQTYTKLLGGGGGAWCECTNSYTRLKTACVEKKSLIIIIVIVLFSGVHRLTALYNIF